MFNEFNLACQGDSVGPKHFPGQSSRRTKILSGLDHIGADAPLSAISRSNTRFDPDVKRADTVLPPPNGESFRIPIMTDVPPHQPARYRLMRDFLRLETAPVSAWILIAALWLLMALPALGLRGAHYEEGTVIALARGALEDGNWLAPYRYGVRFVERPVLLSWMTAAVGSVTGGVRIEAARIIHLLFLLGGGLIVFHLVRTQASKAAGLFGVLCWFGCSMVAQKFITAEPDVMMSVLLFAAFTIWWKGEAAGHISPQRWLVTGLVLTAAALTKGPQPLAYFIFGVGAYLLLKQRWSQLPGFIAANALAIGICAGWYWLIRRPEDAHEWMRHSHLTDQLTLWQWSKIHLDFLGSIIVEWLPGSLLLAPVMVSLVRKPANRDSDLLLALTLYALLCTLALLVWPGIVSSRYAMPANLALAVLAGRVFDTWRVSRPKLIAFSLTFVTAVATYVLVLGWLVMPVLPGLFDKQRATARTINAIREAVPGTLFASDITANYNTLVYVSGNIRVVLVKDLRKLTAPALALLTPDEVADFTRTSPGFSVITHAVLHPNKTHQLVEIRPQ